MRLDKPIFDTNTNTNTNTKTNTDTNTNTIQTQIQIQMKMKHNCRETALIGCGWLQLFLDFPPIQNQIGLHLTIWQA